MLGGATILAGSSVESYKTWACWVDRSKDDGKTWQRFGPINVAGKLHGLIQPSLFETKEGRIIAIMRTRDSLKICKAESKDKGETWSAAEPIEELPNPNSGIDCVKLSTGDLWMIYNHSPLLRTPLNLARSQDDGKTWKQMHTLEKELGEFSYPAIIESSAGMLEMTYTSARRMPSMPHQYLVCSLLCYYCPF